VLYIDDRWLYDVEDNIPPIVELDLRSVEPKTLRKGEDCTLVGNSHSTQLCLEAARTLDEQGISCEVVDLRVVNPLRIEPILASVGKTGRLVAVDGGWRGCGMAGEVIASVVERLEPAQMRTAPLRLTLPDAPAPTSKPLEDIYYLKSENIVETIFDLVNKEN
jgi:pyruvate/2-oxoglutarate/acetoin dehydrogenase E1 component